MALFLYILDTKRGELKELNYNNRLCFALFPVRIAFLQVKCRIWFPNENFSNFICLRTTQHWLSFNSLFNKYLDIWLLCVGPNLISVSIQILWNGQIRLSGTLEFLERKKTPKPAEKIWLFFFRLKATNCVFNAPLFREFEWLIFDLRCGYSDGGAAAINSRKRFAHSKQKCSIESPIKAMRRIKLVQIVH